MSRGPGRVERTISAAFAAEPERIFSVKALCRAAYRDEVDTWPRDSEGRPQPPENRRRSVLRAATKVATRQGRRRWHKCDGEGRHDLFEDEKHYQIRIAANAKAKGMHVAEPGSEPSPDQLARLAEMERRIAEREQARQQVGKDLLAKYDALKEKLEKLEIERDELKAGMELIVLESKATTTG